MSTTGSLLGISPNSLKLSKTIISWEHTVGLGVLRDAALDVGATRRAHVDTKGRGAAG